MKKYFLEIEEITHLPEASKDVAGCCYWICPWKVQLCCSRKYPKPSYRGFFGLKPPPIPLKISLVSYSVEHFGFWDPPPPLNCAITLLGRVEVEESTQLKNLKLKASPLEGQQLQSLLWEQLNFIVFPFNLIIFADFSTNMLNKYFLQYPA